jgi:hypothetical protein
MLRNWFTKGAKIVRMGGGRLNSSTDVFATGGEQSWAWAGNR